MEKRSELGRVLTLSGEVESSETSGETAAGWLTTLLAHKTYLGEPDNKSGSTAVDVACVAEVVERPCLLELTPVLTTG